MEPLSYMGYYMLLCIKCLLGVSDPLRNFLFRCQVEDTDGDK